MGLKKKPGEQPGKTDLSNDRAARVLSGLTGRTGNRAVALSGRCRQCGYLLGSPGHEITCEPLALR